MTTPLDDPIIKDGYLLIRGVNERLLHEGRLTSQAFVSSSVNLGMSVFIKDLIDDDGINPTEFIKNTWQYAVQIKAQSVRAMGLSISRSPTQDNPYHGEVWNIVDNKPQKLSHGQRRQLVKLAQWFIKP